ncbi:MAG: two-component sensor histidine kinase [Spirulinaceae cyanobacterium RM2_2_10]|nr:two-component sensor histidine kinase [Spirulinaceae cyanobacterium RM2_2_10]
MSAPVYADSGELRYVLQAHAVIRDRAQLRPSSLAGYPVIIDEAGTILAHPFPERIGRNIAQEADARRLQSLLRNALAGHKDFLHLFSFDEDGRELLAGYTSINSPLTAEVGQRWAVLAIANLDDALADLEAIRRVLIGLLVALTLTLIAATTAAIFFISRETARPLEQLRDYALNQDNPYASKTIPHDFRIREFSQLGSALETMLQRLRTWTEELEHAWQDARIANQLKDEFLTITSHELRTPLNGILGSLSIIQDDLCDSRAEELTYIHQAQQSALQLYEIITDISDITKLRAGQLKVGIESVNLGDCLRAVIATHEAAIAAKELSLEWTQPDAEVWVYADPDQLQRVLGIVLDNAIKFTAVGGITLMAEVTASAEAASGQQAIITIRDTGIGIEPELQAKLFKPFAVVDGSHTRQYGGVGLGLAIARNLIELMHGHIQLTSAGKNCGTTVAIALPIARQVALASAAAPSSTSNS